MKHLNNRLLNHICIPSFASPFVIFITLCLWLVYIHFHMNVFLPSGITSYFWWSNFLTKFMIVHQLCTHLQKKYHFDKNFFIVNFQKVKFRIWHLLIYKLVANDAGINDKLISYFFQIKKKWTFLDVLIISVKEPLLHARYHNDLLEDNTLQSSSIRKHMRYCTPPTTPTQ